MDEMNRPQEPLENARPEPKEKKAAPKKRIGPAKLFLIIFSAMLVVLFIAISIPILSNILGKAEIVYVMNDDGSYSVSEVKRYHNLEGEVIIPSEYNGAPVTGIMDYAFSRCENITSVVIPDSVTSIGEAAFGACKSLTKVVLPSGIETINNATFSDCTALSEITIPNTVTFIDMDAFRGCTSLTSITIPTSVESIDYSAFSGCSSLHEVYYEGDLEDWMSNGLSGTLVNGADLYLNGEILKNLSITGEIKILYSHFSHCTSLEFVSLPDSVTDLSSQFDYCTSLKSINIPNSTAPLELPIFTGCTALENIAVSPVHTKLRSIEGDLYNKNGDTLIKYAVGKKDTRFVILDGVVEVAPHAFSGSTHLTTIDVPSSVERIYADALVNCTSLTTINYDGTIEQWEELFSTYFEAELPAAEVICTDGSIPLK